MANPVARIAVAILLIGLVVGVLRSWLLRNEVANGTAVNGGVTSVVLLTSTAKSIWIQRQVKQFNVTNDKVQVVVRFVEDRDAMTGILYGRQQPELWCPDSPLWVERINELWEKQHGAALVDEDPSNFRLLMRSPLVFLTTKKKAAFLQPLLGSGNAWANMAKLSTGGTRAPWGSFHYGIADPIASNSGVLALAMAAGEYAHQDNNAELTAHFVSDPGFSSYLTELQKGSRMYASTIKLTSAYVDDPKIADLIITQESLAVDAVRHNDQLVVIYPQPTLEADESICVVDGPWASADQKALAHKFVDFLSRPDAVSDLPQFDMHPPPGLDETGIAADLAKFHDNGLSGQCTVATPPTYGVLNALAYQWNLLSHGQLARAQ